LHKEKMIYIEKMQLFFDLADISREKRPKKGRRFYILKTFYIFVFIVY